MQDSYTIAEIVNKFVEESPTRYETPGVLGHPNLFLPLFLNRLLSTSTPLQELDKKNRGRPARKYSRQDIAAALKVLPSALENAQKPWVREQAVTLKPIIDKLISELKRE